MNHKYSKLIVCVSILLLAMVFVLSSCATSTTTSTKAVKGGSINKDAAPSTPNLKKVISVAKFETSLADKNTSKAYASAAYDTLVNKLQGTGKFIVFEEKEFAELNNYIQSTGGAKLQKQLAQYMIVGKVNSVASKTTGGSFFGISSKTTTVEASVTLRLIDTSNGQVIYAEEGQGTADNTSTSVNSSYGTVSGSGYDPASLEAKAISAAMDSLINNIIRTCDQNPWQSELFADQGSFFMIGGKSVGIKDGMTLAVYKRGKTVKNPQTGAMIELPGEKVADAKVLQTFPGNTPEDEISAIEIKNGIVMATNPEDYVIREK